MENECNCINCGFDDTGWTEITKECKVEIKFTTSGDFGYVVLSYKKTNIGSFNWGNTFMYYNGAHQRKTVEKYYKVVLIPPKGDLCGYFKVYKAKDMGFGF